MYEIFAPPKHLSDVVRYYWLLDLRTGNRSLTEHLFAYPYVNWVFTLGTPYTVRDDKVGTIIVKDTRILGPRSNYAEYLHPEGNLAFGVTFQFGSTLPIFKEETQFLTDKVIVQEEILPSANWLNACFQETTLETFLVSLNMHLRKQNSVSSERGFILWQQFLELLMRGENYGVSTNKLSKEMGVSQRHLQRVSLKYSGFTPKLVQSMLRCRLAVRHIQKSGCVFDFFQYGYYDQNHFIKEVKRWSGLTPGELFSLLNIGLMKG